MSHTTLTTDVAIIGAGVAGLWLHNRLNDLGYHTLLLENDRIGQGQTLSSQGIIHGGSKYALNGILSKAAEVISTMPARWKACLDGQGDIDLSQTRILTPHQLLWSTNNLSSKMVTFFASKALRSRMASIPARQRPTPFDEKAFKGALYQLDEPVLDVPSLITQLTTKWQSRILATSKEDATEWLTSEGGIHELRLGNNLTIRAQHFVLTAGEGNEAMIASLPIGGPAMQRRPLQMVLCKSQDPNNPLPVIYAHSLGSGAKPIATISTHFDSNNNTVWYIGGKIAEEGVGKSQSVLIQEAQALLADILPWVTLPELEWASHAVNRAEPKQSSLTRPDSAFVSSHDNIHVCWPTKLALAPDLADQMLATLKQQGLSAERHDNPTFPSPELGIPLWDRAFQ